jgi:hypothetical protein
MIYTTDVTALSAMNMLLSTLADTRRKAKYEGLSGREPLSPI